MNLATPQDLIEAPERAVLELLDAALQQAIYALFAAHSELLDTDSLEDCGAATPQLWIADAIYNQATALQHTINRYRQACEAATSFRRR